MAKPTKNRQKDVIIYGFWCEVVGTQRAMHKARESSKECTKVLALCDCAIAKEWFFAFLAAERKARELA